MTLASDSWSLALGDLSLSEGLRMREAAQARFFPGSDATRFRKLCTIQDLDAFLSSEAAREPRVSLADSSRQGSSGVPAAEFATEEGGEIDLARLLSLFDRGATLIVSQFHETHPPLARFCRGLERIFLHPVQCNVYLTPPNGQGFRTHYDTHDVLVLQIQGQKLWRFWSTRPIPFANNQTPWRNQTTPEGEPLQQLMIPGNVLYLPRGTLHDAASGGVESSLHLTIGLLDLSWGDAIRAALDVMEPRDPTLRQSFPTWRLAEGGISDDLVHEAGKRLVTLGATTTLELMSQQMLANLARERMPMFSRGIIAPKLTPTDLLLLSDAVHTFVVPLQDGGAELSWKGGTLPLTAQELTWLAMLNEHTTAAALGGADALVFCQKLAEIGLLEVQTIKSAISGGRVQ